METYERLRQMIVADYNLPPEKLQPEARLDELGIDSLGVMELLFKVEDDFHIRLPSEQAELATIDEVVKYIDRLVLEQHGQNSEYHGQGLPSKPGRQEKQSGGDAAGTAS